MSVMTDDNLQIYSERLKEAVLENPEMSQDKVTRKEMYTYLYKLSNEGKTFIPAEHREKVISSLLNAWYTFDVLQPLMDDPYVTDVHVIGTTTLVQRKGNMYESTEARFGSEKAIEEFVLRQLDDTPYAYSQADPITDAILPGGYRLNIIGGPSTRYTIRHEDGRIDTEQRTIVTIRKPIHPFTLEELVELKVMDHQTREFIRLMMALGDSFLIAGGVGSAKTTLMNAFTGDIPKGLFNIIVEELPEMTPLCDWCVRLTDKSGNFEGKGRIDMVRNIINSLRMNNANGFIGEVRSAYVAYQFLRMNLLVKRQTGTTFHTHVGHKNGVEGVITRFLLEAAEGAEGRASYLNIASMMADKMRFIFTMRDTKHGKRITEIGEVLGFDFEKRALLWQPLLTYDTKSDTCNFHGVSEEMAERAENEGIEVSLPPNTQEIRYYRIAP
jgi:pilus assembly protein CpaF